MFYKSSYQLTIAKLLSKIGVNLTTKQKK